MLRISGHEKTEKILKALASKTRLQILEYVRKGVSDPNEIARRLKRHRSTTEQHLRILLEAKIIQKVTSSSKDEQPTIRYGIRENANELLVTIQESCQNF